MDQEKRKEENVDYVVIKDVVNIYLNIIKKFVEANKEKIIIMLSKSVIQA